MIKSPLGWFHRGRTIPGEAAAQSREPGMTRIAPPASSDQEEDDTHDDDLVVVDGAVLDFGTLEPDHSPLERCIGTN